MIQSDSIDSVDSKDRRQQGREQVENTGENKGQTQLIQLLQLIHWGSKPGKTQCRSQEQSREQGGEEGPDSVRFREVQLIRFREPSYNARPAITDLESEAPGPPA